MWEAMDSSAARLIILGEPNEQSNTMIAAAYTSSLDRERVLFTKSPGFSRLNACILYEGMDLPLVKNLHLITP